MTTPPNHTSETTPVSGATPQASGTTPSAGGRLRATKRESSPRLGAILITIGTAVALAAIALLAFIVLRIASLETEALRRVAEDNVSYWAEFGFVKREVSLLSGIIAAPALMLLVATSFLIPGYLIRRGTIRGGTPRFWTGGTNQAKYLPLAFWAHALWMLVPLAAWAALILVPLRSMIDGGWPAGIPDENMNALWLALGCYGALAAGMFGVMVTSFVKKAVYVRIIARNPAAATSSSAIWRWVTFRWRFDLWLAGVGAALVGASVIALGFDDVPIFLTFFTIGGVLFIGGMLLSLNYWRAGEPLGSAESYS